MVNVGNLYLFYEFAGSCIRCLDRHHAVIDHFHSPRYRVLSVFIPLGSVFNSAFFHQISDAKMENVGHLFSILFLLVYSFKKTSLCKSKLFFNTFDSFLLTPRYYQYNWTKWEKEWNALQVSK